MHTDRDFGEWRSAEVPPPRQDETDFLGTPRPAAVPLRYPLLLPLPSSPLRGAPRTSNASFGHGERMGGRMRARDEAHLCNARRMLYRR